MASLQSGRRIHRLWGLPSCRDLIASGPTCDFVGEDMIVRRSDTIAVELDLNNSSSYQNSVLDTPSRFDSVSFFSNSNKPQWFDAACHDWSIHMLTIGDLSKTTGVKVPTIRYYEQMGLLSHTERSEGNQRRYSKTERERLSFIKHARELGLTIEAIRELIDLSQHPEKPCEEADGIAAKQLVTVREKIQRLKKLEAELERISTHCNSNQVRDCYVIRALANHCLCSTEHD